VTALPDRYVRSRFDALAPLFRDEVAPVDFRLAAIRRALPPRAGLRILDLGTGKGRFARHLADEGAHVVGLDASAAMLGAARGLDRVHASADRLPFRDRAFDAVVAVEVIEHLADLDPVLAEVHRVLRPGGVAVLIDKNRHALDARLPIVPAVVRKWLDERRGRWMYPADAPFRERWFAPGALARRLRSRFDDVRVESLLRPEEASWSVFRRVPRARLFTLWIARRGGATHA
jgi:2-polyprenyl-6-hydroxyphenyl methylase/3-demethylubiquinone-9 3-methyltransferase